MMRKLASVLTLLTALGCSDVKHTEGASPTGHIPASWLSNGSVDGGVVQPQTLAAKNCSSADGGSCAVVFPLPNPAVGTVYLWVMAQAPDGGFANSAAKYSCSAETATTLVSDASVNVTKTFRACTALEALAYTDAGLDAGWHEVVAVADAAVSATLSVQKNVHNENWKVVEQFVGQP